MKKTTEDFKKEMYELFGNEYSLIGEYINSKTKVKIKHNCKECNNYVFEIKPSLFLKKDFKCKRCINSKKFKDNVNRLSNGEYTVLGNYVNNQTKIKIRHDICGHEYEVVPANFIKGRRCPKCFGNNKMTIDEYKQKIKEIYGDEYTVLGEEYINNRTGIEVRHNCEKCNNYVWKPNPYHFLRGTKCPRCNGGHYEKTIKEFKEDVYNQVGEEYSVIGEYTSNCEKIEMKHNKCGNIYSVSPSNFLQGYRCPKCSRNMISNIEKEIFDFIKNDLKENIIENDRKVLNGKEIDIYIPEKKVAIEFDGLYWHSENVGTNKNYHLEKTKLCKEKNIRLIHIFEDEWNNKESIVKSKIRYILRNNNEKEKIYARKCNIKIIDSRIKNDFLNKNHIQGEDKSSISLGLYYKNNLVSVMTFCKPRISLGQKGNKYDYELSRFASDIRYIVIGSFSKLFKYFERNYKWNKIITYADRRWSEGDVYIKNGWKHVRDSNPNYWYCKSNNVRLHRYGFRKQALKGKFPNIYDDSLTEFQIMDKTKYRRIWDCGNMVFEYTR